MPRCLSAYAHERIIRMWQQGKTPAAIVRELAQDGICTTSRTVKRRIFAWTKGDGLEDRRRSGQLSSITKEIAEYMDRMLEDDDELTGNLTHGFLHLQFGDFWGWSCSGSLSEPELAQWSWKPTRRSAWTLPRSAFLTDSFDDVIWTDESSIQLVRHTRSSSLRSFFSASSSSAPPTPEGPLPPPGIAVSWCRPLPLLRQWCPWHRRECVLHLRDSFPPCTNGPSTRLVPHFSSETWCATKLFSFYTM